MLHAVCRDFFGTIPIAPRVFYLTSSNDVVKSFDMAHCAVSRRTQVRTLCLRGDRTQFFKIQITLQFAEGFVIDLSRTMQSDQFRPADGNRL